MNRIDYSLLRYVYPEFSNKKIDYINTKIKKNNKYITSINNFYQRYSDFKCHIYLNLNRDLNRDFNRDISISKNERYIIYHFLKYGINENRPYKYTFDHNTQNNSQLNILNINRDLIKHIKVSVIIPLFNHHEYIIDCINNIINQTHKNIEIIIVDDCSTDGSYDLVNDFIKSNNNDTIKLLKTKKNSGCYYARNIGIHNSIGDYIVFQDSDDLSLSSRIEDVLYGMIISNKRIGFSNIYRIKYFDIPSDIVSNDQQLMNLCDQDKNESQMITHDLGIVTSIIDRKLFDKYGLYNDKMRHSSDLEFIERVYCLELNVNPYDINHMHSFIKENSNDLIYYNENNENNENVNYICRKMNTNNNTFIYKEKERKNYMNEWKKNIYNQMSFS